jgi:hypothetical protein
LRGASVKRVGPSESIDFIMVRRSETHLGLKQMN